MADCGSSGAAVYFTLTDGDAELQCMTWASRYRSMDIEIEDGVEVVLEGDVDFWVEGGRLDLKPWSITVVGDGDHAASVERLRAELDERGWFHLRSENVGDAGPRLAYGMVPRTYMGLCCGPEPRYQC